MLLTRDQFDRVRSALKGRFGIDVDEGKRHLVSSRLSRLVREGGYADFATYEKAELGSDSSPGWSRFIDELTTNHTFWWRESAHFEFFSDVVLPEWTQKLQGTRDFRLWCAVASTGEEPYTLAMLLREHFRGQYGQWQAGLLASDISSDALKTATAAEYSATDITPLPSALQSYFRPAGPGRVVVAPEVRRDVSFRRINLMNHPFRFRAPMHAIFLRNVMIYFDPPTNRALARALHDALAPGGYLFVGHSEPLDRASNPFEIVGPSIYRRRA